MGLPFAIHVAVAASFAARPPPLSLSPARAAVSGVPVAAVAHVQRQPRSRVSPGVLFDASEIPPEPEDEDVFEELSADLTPMQQRLKKMNPFVFGTAANSAGVVGAILAWFITPPIGRVAALASLSLGGVGGSQLSKRMRSARRGLVPSAIADMVRERGLDSIRTRDVAALQERYGVDAVEFEAQLSDIYGRFLRQLLGEAEGAPTPSMVRELGCLRRGMGLGGTPPRRSTPPRPSPSSTARARRASCPRSSRRYSG